MEFSMLIAFFIGLVVLYAIGKVVSLPMRLLWKLITNSIIGGIMLWIINLFGVGLQINLINALIAGIFGIPGVIGLIIYKFI
ncbi:inhibitor of the pro-sigma K processing machinery [Propionispira arboris]|jgi:inhibitor of the pro-sigma K processing machinery|uniref:Inhibitor of the pro-sigma K processing machinery n=1 Tax=Propionispira arboris TaxID=84035 RepID=A0A1H6YUG9_9FIRM|nr:MULTISPECIES: pro-sigmaK processing inhibitor BofA family protein [Propionispira]SEJ43966.1 inhibitor of the pro-sigma K processing machinery [Propionispira arboris]